MSITDELREFANRYKLTINDRLLAIADRIDEEHKHAVMSAMNDALYHANDESMAELGWVRLPKDADGVPIRMGDEMELTDEAARRWDGDKHFGKVMGLELTVDGWTVEGDPATDLRHVKPDSWERIIGDALTVGWQNGNWNEVASAEIHERLVGRCRRLAGE